MNFLGIGPLELIVIFIIILVVLGPKDMIKTGKNIGSFFRKLATSDFWKVMTQARNELSTLPNKLAREAGIEEIQKEINDMKTMGKDLNINKIGNPLDSWTSTPNPGSQKENSIDSDKDEIDNLGNEENKEEK